MGGSTHLRSSRKRLAALALGAVALVASACSAETTIDASATGSTEVTTAQASAPADTGAATDELPYGPEPVFEQYRVDASALTSRGEPVGTSFVETKLYVAGSDTQERIEYYAVGTESGPIGVWLARGPEATEVCATSALGCAAGVRQGFSGDAITARVAVQFAPLGEYVRVLAPDGLELPSLNAQDGYWGWTIEGDTSFNGYQGRCYVSVGEYALFADDPIEPTKFPAGDRMCAIFYGTGQSKLLSYDSGGDGTSEYQAVQLRADWSDADLVLQNNATSAPVDQAAFDALLAAWADADPETLYPLSN